MNFGGETLQYVTTCQKQYLKLIRKTHIRHSLPSEIVSVLSPPRSLAAFSASAAVLSFLFCLGPHGSTLGGDQSLGPAVQPD